MSTMRRILFATDLNGTALSAVEYLAALAFRLGAELHLLHVLSDRPVTDGAAVDRAATPDAPRREIDRLSLAAALDRAEVVTAIRAGHPADQILAYAEQLEVGLIAVGSRGRGSIAQTILGSVAQQVTRRATCPVIVIPPTCFKLNGRRLGSAAAALAAEFGPGLIGPQDPSRHQFAKVLQESLQLGEAESLLAVETLAKAGVLRWHDGDESNSLNSRFWSIHPEAAPAAPTIIESAIQSEPTNAASDLLALAIESRASDAHITPRGDRFEVCFRIDGRLEHYCWIDRPIALPIIQAVEAHGTSRHLGSLHPAGRTASSHQPSGRPRSATFDRARP